MGLHDNVGRMRELLLDRGAALTPEHAVAPPPGRRFSFGVDAIG